MLYLTEELTAIFSSEYMNDTLADSCIRNRRAEHTLGET